MSVLFVLVFGIIGIISGTFGYYLNELELFTITFGVFLIYIVINRYKKWVILTLALTVIGGLGSALYFYQKNNLDILLKPIRDFFKVYYYSVVLEGYYITQVFQVFIIAMLCLALFYVYHFFYRRKRYQWIPIIIGFVFLFVAYLSGYLTSAKDHRAFLLFLISGIIYYFAIYSQKNVEDIQRIQRYTFYGMGIIFSLGIIGFGLLFHKYQPNPFEKTIQSSSVSSNSTNSSDQSSEFERAVVENISDGLYQVQSTFEHEGIALFSVDADTLKYYMTDIYDIYEQGLWSQSSDTSLRPFMDYDEEIYTKETVEITYENIISNRILVSPLWENINMSEEMQAIIEDETFLQRGFNYKIDAVIPRYRTIAWQEAIESNNSSETIDGYLQLPDASERIYNLALEITENAESNYEKGRMIEAFLSSEYTYNEIPKYSPSSDMIEAFLFEEKEGFCQQFASSMVLMMRSLGIPSRFVVGYVLDAEAYDEVPDSLMYAYGDVAPERKIYDYNAHTWVESYFPGVGWVQFEPTAGQNFYSFYDPDTLEREVTDYKPTEELSLNNKDTIMQFGLALIFVIIFLIVMSVLLRRRHANRKNFMKRISCDYQIFLLYINNCLDGKKQSETIREFAMRIHHETSLDASHFQDYLETLEKAFYNRKVPSIEQIQEFERYIVRIKKVAKRRMPFLSFQKKRMVEIMTYFR